MQPANSDRNPDRNPDRIDCEDLLIGLSRVGRGVAAAVLIDAGFDPAELGPAPAAT